MRRRRRENYLGNICKNQKYDYTVIYFVTDCSDDEN